jgi:transcription initiation factor TFIIIB Brf1 subunit/transcription initiation factor TFIIB
MVIPVGRGPASIAIADVKAASNLRGCLQLL